MIIQKPTGTFEILPISKNEYSVTINNSTVKADAYIRQTNKGQKYLTLARSVTVQGNTADKLAITDEQAQQLKEEHENFKKQKEKEIVNFMKTVDLENIEMNVVYGYRLVLIRNDEKLAKEINDYKNYDLNFVIAAFYEFAASRYNSENGYYKNEIGQMEPKITFRKKNDEVEIKQAESRPSKTPEQVEFENEMYERALLMTDEEFEDIYDLPRERFLI